MKSTAEFHPVVFRCFNQSNIMSGMGQDSHRYLRAWRLHRHLTQDQVVDRLAIHEDTKLPRSKAQLSKVENGNSPYSQRLLEALADIYQCETWELLGRDPHKQGQVIDLLAVLDEQERERTLAFIESLKAARAN